MLNMARLSVQDRGFEPALKDLLRGAAQSGGEDLQAQVRRIIAGVAAGGDRAVLEYAATYDGNVASSVAGLCVDRAGLCAALTRVPTATRASLEFAAERIRAFHVEAASRQGSWQYRDQFGNLLGRRVTPLQRVGFYIPGGQACYPSSALMSLIPAEVAGVPERIAVSPVAMGPSGDLVLAALALAGASMLFRIGGAHGVAALAWGTETMPGVDKIVGPGGAYVTEAKRQLCGRVGIDLTAGPSEILIVSDGSAPAATLALDLCAQAEHDAAARAWLVTTDAQHLDAVAAALERELTRQQRAAIIAQSLSARGALIHCRDLPQAVTIVNRMAPEHLQLAVGNPGAIVEAVEHAGAIFIGARTAEVFGDYVAGPSHVLPTGGTARFSSPLGVQDFVKASSLIEISAPGFAALAPHAARLARAEGLYAHAESAECRSPAAKPLSN